MKSFSNFTEPQGPPWFYSWAIILPQNSDLILLTLFISCLATMVWTWNIPLRLTIWKLDLHVVVLFEKVVGTLLEVELCSRKWESAGLHWTFKVIKRVTWMILTYLCLGKGKFLTSSRFTYNLIFELRSHYDYLFLTNIPNCEVI